MARNEAYRKAVQKIEAARRAGAKVLDLSAKWDAPDSEKLTELPAALRQLAQLQSLNLSNNQLTALPEWLGQLTQLQVLVFSGNRLTALPESLGQLTQLQTLDLSRNQLTVLPESLGQLTQLRELVAYFNKLNTIPAGIGRLAKLKVLSVSGNHLTSLPSEIGDLQNLTELYIAQNDIERLPDAVGNLGQLRKLIVGGHELSLNAHWSASGRNRLTVLPESLGQLTQLRTLDLSNNELTALPESLRKLTGLTRLYLHGNDALELPTEMLGKGNRDDHAKPADILAYYFRARTAARPLHEFKLILVGHGAVGKTALVNRLVRDSFMQTDMTRGIHIEPWQVPAGEDTLAAHVWDFGGQDIMHGTHQFFLTRRSLYLLVLAARESRQNDDAEYWLKTINAFGDDSPVIVVLNKSDERPFDVNENALRKKYPAIRAFIKTDCLSARGVDELRAKVSEVADQLDGVRDLFPEQWFAIKNRISGMRESYLTFEQFRKECAELGEAEADGQEKLAAVLHVLGIALNFRDDERLRETSVLNPLWVTGGIYSLLNDNEIAVRHGLLTLADFARVLPEKEYPADSHEFLRELMCKFELCFPIGEQRSGQYLIPELLGEQEPDEASPLDVNESLAFSYHYQRLLPHGLVPRLIVRLYPLIADKLRWRTGVVLDWFKARALVKSDSDDRSVRIRVHGDKIRSRELLAIIRSEFDTLHRQFHGLLPVERVQLPEYPEVAVEYSHLEAAIRVGLKVMPVFTEGNMIQVSPREILEYFEVPGEPRDAGDRGALETEPTPPRHRAGKGGRQ